MSQLWTEAMTHRLLAVARLANDAGTAHAAGLPHHDLEQRRALVDGLEKARPPRCVQTRPVVECHAQQPRIRMHRHQRQPVPPLHPVVGLQIAFESELLQEGGTVQKLRG